MIYDEFGQKGEPIVLKLSQRNTTPLKDPVKLTKNKKTKGKFKIPYLTRHIMEFFKTTGLHGYKYIAMENTPMLERVFWGIIVFACLIAAIVLVIIAWQWNSQNPTITVIESTHYAIWKIPFPAVTICSLNKVSIKDAKSFVKSLIIPPILNQTQDGIYGQLRYMPGLLGNILLKDPEKNELRKLQSILDYNNITMKYLFERMTPSCKEILERCSWKGSTIRCESLFQKVNSIEGLCCSFNYHAAIKSNFPKNIAFLNGKQPRRIAACGYQTALSVLIKTVPEKFYSSTFGTAGVRVYIHDGYDYADENASAKLVGIKTETFMEMTAEATYATSAIRSIQVEKRKCIFSNEAKSSSFSTYSYNNCLAECRSEIVFSICNCVPFFFPNNEKRKHCNFNDIDCINEARTFYMSSQPTAYNNVSCKCLPDCEHYSYPMEMAMGTLTRVSAHNSLSFFKGVNISSQALLHVYFSDLVGTRYRTDVFLSWHNLLASFGGLLGLFVGFSLVSGFELIYFFTLRFFFDMMHGKSANAESGPDGEKK